MKFSLSFQRNEDFMENKDCRFTISIRKAAVFLLHSILLFLNIIFSNNILSVPFSGH